MGFVIRIFNSIDYKEIFYANNCSYIYFLFVLFSFEFCFSQNFVPQFLDQLTESDLKVETKTEPKSDTLSTVIRWLRYLASRIPDNEKECRNLDALRLKMILRFHKKYSNINSMKTK